MHFRRISIMGVGLLGGSLGLAVKRLGLAESVVGIGHRDSTLKEAVRRGAIDRFTLDAAEGVAGADLVVLATPVGLFGELMGRAAPALEPGCLITDVGSTKRSVLRSVVPHVPESCRFVGSHPVAGSEARGIQAADGELYRGALVLVVPTERSDEEAVERTEQLWQALGATVQRIDAEAHDRLLARSSHLPHLVAAALVQALSDDAETLVGAGFLDTTRIASGDAALWRDIFMSNSDELLAAVDEFRAVLEALRSALARGDGEAVRSLLEAAKQRRDRLLDRR